MAWILNARQIGQTNTRTVKKGSPIYAENLKIHILGDNCKIDFNSDLFQGVNTVEQ
ncbi:hypothetical protein [uncultured Chryseobacterium sp.]|nr:hypothetical protein [uncultured Chryseobacterium sp.]